MALFFYNKIMLEHHLPVVLCKNNFEILVIELAVVIAIEFSVKVLSFIYFH